MVDLVIDESKVWSPEERQKYADALPEMSLFEDHIIEGDVMVEAIQALTEEGETAQTLAIHWKSKGNEMFMDAKKYNRMYFDNALAYYTDALSYALKAQDAPEEELVEDIAVPELISTILSNRAAVHLEIRNNGSCRSDCARAIKHWPRNIKAYYRGAKASIRLRKPEDALVYVSVGLKMDPANDTLPKLKTQAESLLVAVEQERAIEEQKRQARCDQTNAYRRLCQERMIRVGSAIITDNRVAEHQGKVHVEEDGVLYWPVLFLYSEYGQSDFVNMFGENDMFIEHLANMFPEGGPYCPWDERADYVASRLSIYLTANVVVPLETEDEWHVALSGQTETDTQMQHRERQEEILDSKNTFWLRVSPFCTLLQVLQHEQYVVPGIPVVSIVVRDSNHEKQFLRKIQHRVIKIEQNP